METNSYYLKRRGFQIVYDPSRTSLPYFCFTEEEISIDRFPAHRYNPHRFLADYVWHEFRLRFQLREETGSGSSNHSGK